MTAAERTRERDEAAQIARLISEWELPNVALVHRVFYAQLNLTKVTRPITISLSNHIIKNKIKISMYNDHKNGGK